MDASIYSLPPSLQLEIERRRPGCTAQVRACINEAQALGDQYEKRASRARTIQQAKHLRDNLARSLKGLVMELSPLLSKDAGAAEEWVASVLDWLSIKFPARETDSAAFAAMFGREGQRAQEHAEAQVAHAVRFAAAAKEEASKVRSAQLARWCEMEIERRTEEMIQREIARQRERLAAD